METLSSKQESIVQQCVIEGVSYTVKINRNYFVSSQYGKEQENFVGMCFCKYFDHGDQDWRPFFMVQVNSRKYGISRSYFFCSSSAARNFYDKTKVKNLTTKTFLTYDLRHINSLEMALRLIINMSSAEYLLRSC